MGLWSFVVSSQTSYIKKEKSCGWKWMEKHMILERKAHNSMRTEIPVYLYELPNSAASNNVCANCNRYTLESAQSGKRLIRPAVKGITAAV